MTDTLDTKITEKMACGCDVCRTNETSGLNLQKSVHKNKPRNAMEAGDDKYQTCFMKYVKNKACQLYFTHVSSINFLVYLCMGKVG